MARDISKISFSLSVFSLGLALAVALPSCDDDHDSNNDVALVRVNAPTSTVIAPRFKAIAADGLNVSLHP